MPKREEKASQKAKTRNQKEFPASRGPRQKNRNSKRKLTNHHDKQKIKRADTAERRNDAERIKQKRQVKYLMQYFFANKKNGNIVSTLTLKIVKSFD